MARSKPEQPQVTREELRRQRGFRMDVHYSDSAQTYTYAELVDRVRYAVTRPGQPTEIVEVDEPSRPVYLGREPWADVYRLAEAELRRIVETAIECGTRTEATR